MSGCSGESAAVLTCVFKTPNRLFCELMKCSKMVERENLLIQARVEGAKEEVNLEDLRNSVVGEEKAILSNLLKRNIAKHITEMFTLCEY